MRRLRRLSVTFALGLSALGCATSPGVTAEAPRATIEPSFVSPPAVEDPGATPAPPSALPAVTTEPGDSVPLPADTYARVVTNDLRVRSKPGVSDDSKKLEPLAQSGDVFVILDGPAQESGYDWYRVKPTNNADAEQPLPSGWVAAGDKDGEPWIESVTPDCPASPSGLRDVAGWNRLDEMYFQITCFSGRELTFQGWLVTPTEWCGLGDWPEVQPAWLGECTTAPNYLVEVGDIETETVLHPAWSPDVDLSIAPPVESPPGAWPNVEITGMFDHPAAQSCTPVELVFDCRLQFVVTAMRAIDG